MDDGLEFAECMLERWAYLNRVELDVSRAGRPGDDAFVEASSDRLRQGRPNASWFLSMGGGRTRIEARRADRAHDRPRSALGGSTPAAADRPKPARKVA